jgi:hypothetical protein
VGLLPTRVPELDARIVRNVHPDGSLRRDPIPEIAGFVGILGRRLSLGAQIAILRTGVAGITFT